MAFIDDMRAQGYAVESTCRVLTEHGCPVAARTYRSWRTTDRTVAARTVSDAVVLDALLATRNTPEALYGRRKMTHLLRRRGLNVAFCTVDRLMRDLGMSGVQRGKRPRTTIPAKDGQRAGDLLDRDFTAPGPNRVWVADFTYVRTWAGFCYVAFIVDVFAQKIVAWHAATDKRTDLVLTPLRMALWDRDRLVGLASWSGQAPRGRAEPPGVELLIDRLRERARGAWLLGDQPGDLSCPPLVHGEALVDQRRVIGERVAVTGQHLRDLHLARLAQRGHVGQQRARAVFGDFTAHVFAGAKRTDGEAGAVNGFGGDGVGLVFFRLDDHVIGFGDAEAEFIDRNRLDILPVRQIASQLIDLLASKGQRNANIVAARASVAKARGSR